MGTVMTGTVLGGVVRVGQTVEIPHLREERKVKSVQMLKRPVQSAANGDRAALCVTNLSPDLMKRGARDDARQRAHDLGPHRARAQGQVLCPQVRAAQQAAHHRGPRHDAGHRDAVRLGAAQGAGRGRAGQGAASGRL
jgi:hypothetical protein